VGKGVEHFRENILGLIFSTERSIKKLEGE
jgi:hypothetical protein